MKKRISTLTLLSYIISLFLIIPPGFTAVQQNPRLTLVSSASTVKTGDIFTVEVGVETGAEAVYGLDTTLHYDTSLVERQDFATNQPYQKGSGFDTDLFIFKNGQEQTAGDLTSSAASKVAQSGNLKLVVYRFKALKSGKADFSFDSGSAVIRENGQLASVSCELGAKVQVKISNTAGGTTGGGGSTGGSLPVTPAAGTGSVEDLTVPAGSLQTTVTNEDGRSISTVTLKEDQLLADIKAKSDLGNIVIEVNDDSQTLNCEISPAILEALAEQGQGVKLSTPRGAYTLPAPAIDLEALAGQAGVPVAQLKVVLSIAEASQAAKASIENYAKEQGLTLVGSPVEFTVQIKAGEKVLEIERFGSYVSREINLPQTVDPAKAVGVMLNPDGTLSPVPTQFSTEQGVTVATLKRQGNSIYAVIQNDKSFQDLKGHWAQNDINQLASKMIINGMTDKTFAPEAPITRAQFAAILTRALALEEKASTETFTDVRAEAWYAKAVGAAVTAGIIKGNGDGTFKPEARITRQEMAVMLVRALELTGSHYELTSAEVQDNLAPFKDKGQIADWAGSAVATSVKAGLITGSNDGSFAPARFGTRAEAAVMLKKLLVEAEFI